METVDKLLEKAKSAGTPTLVIGAAVVTVGAVVAKLGVWRTLMRARRTMDLVLTGKLREEQMLDYLFERATPGNAESVMRTIDEFCEGGRFLMNVGPEKGLIVDAEVEKRKPRVAIECGAYCGYSAVRIGRTMQKHGGKLYSLELNPLYAAIATKVVELAGLQDTVKVLVGAAATTVPKLAAEFPHGVELVFLDHWKDAYVPDLKLMLEKDLLADKAVVVADNVIFPGAPEYLKFVRSHASFTSVYHESHLEYSKTVIDGVEVSTYTRS